MGAASHLAHVPPNYLFTQLLQSIFKGMHNDSCDGNGYMNIDMLIFLAKINALFVCQIELKSMIHSIYTQNEYLQCEVRKMLLNELHPEQQH